jgi:uncharacterized membrane protein YfcA
MDFHSVLGGIVSGSDLRPLWVVMITLAAGASRGFSGFGSGMIFIPLVSALYSPLLAIALLFVIDFICTTPMLPPHFRNCNWREVLPLLIASSITFPLGLYFLTRLDPVIVRWCISLFIGFMVVVMVSGWRYRATPTAPTVLGIGALSGFVSGAIGTGGSLIVLFWLGSQARAARVRSNIFAYFGLFAVVNAVGYWLNGMLTRDVVVAALVLLPVYLVPIFLGQHIFNRSSDVIYRRVSLTFCGAVSLITLPLWERLGF